MPASRAAISSERRGAHSAEHQHKLKPDLFPGPESAAKARSNATSNATSPPAAGTEAGKEADDPLNDTLKILKTSLTADVKPKQQDFIVSSLWFSIAVNLMTLANTVQMGFEADHPDWTGAWLITENVFTAGFFMEMVTKLIVLRCRYFHDKANWLDGSLTVLGVVDCWILANLPGSGGADLQSLSVLRILRLARLARVLKLVRSVKPMVLVIQGVAQTVSTTMYVFALLIVIFYVFAIFLTEHMGKNVDGTMYPGFSTSPEEIDDQSFMKSYNPHIAFGSMTLSMLTLFNMAILSEWPEIVRPIALKQPLYVGIFMMFAIFVGFGVMNVMIGLIVDGVISESKRIDEAYGVRIKKEKVQTLERVQQLLMDMDTNQDGMVDVTELSSAMKTHPFLNQLLATIDLPSGWSSDELLYMLDNNGDGLLQKIEFVTSFLRLIESDDFQQLCIVQAGINQVKSMIQAGNKLMESRVSAVEAEISFIKDVICPSSERQISSPHFSSEPLGDTYDPDTRGAASDKLWQSSDGVCNDLSESIQKISQKDIMATLEEEIAKMKSSLENRLENQYSAAQSISESNFAYSVESPDLRKVDAVAKRNQLRQVPPCQDRSYLPSVQLPSASPGSDAACRLESDASSSEPSILKDRSRAAAALESERSAGQGAGSKVVLVEM